MKTLAIALALLFAVSSAGWAQPQKKADAWYPRTETVGPDEMFVVALGTVL